MDYLKKPKVYMHNYMMRKKLFNWEFINSINQVLYIWNLLTTGLTIWTMNW